MTKGFKKACVITTLMLFGAQASTLSHAQQSRIINGKRASTSTYPWLASLFIVHPNYNPNKETSANSHDFDIALIELESAVNITPVQLFTGAIPSAISAIVAGWGATVGDGSTPSDNLLATQLVTIAENTCTAAHEGSITANMFCAGGCIGMG